MRRAVALMALLSAQGCSLITGGDCNAIGYYGVIATVRDARTQLPLSSATVTLQDGPYVDVRTTPSLGPGEYGLAMSREGLYSLTVQATGYQPFVKNNIRVNGGSCSKVDTNNVEVQLTPIP